MKSGAPSLRRNVDIKKTDFAIFGVILIAAWLLFMYPDTMETANHSYLLLENIFSGNFMGFYENVQQHANELYYLNSAHYNIVFYLTMALLQLPVFIVNKLFALSVNEYVLWLWTNGISAAFYVASAFVVRKLALVLGIEEKLSTLCGFAFLLNPIAFFYPAALGEYDSLCVFFVLVALVYYAKKDMLRFSLIMGLASLYKSFALFVFLPLILLGNKKLLQILKYAAIGLAPYLVTGLLFRGRMGEAAIFNAEMTSRLFATAVGAVSLFPLAMAVICALCWLCKAEEPRQLGEKAVYVCLAVFGTFLLTVFWHPQWFYLMVPFWVLAAFLQKNKLLYLYMVPITTVGMFLRTWTSFPEHHEANTLFFGILGLAKTGIENTPVTALSHYISFSPMLSGIASSLIYCAVGVILITRLPLFQKSPLGNNVVAKEPENLKAWIWLDFLFGCGFWLCAVAVQLVLSAA